MSGDHLYASSIPGRALRLLREHGAGFLARKVLATAGRLVYAHTLLRHRTPGTFTFRGREHTYFCHPYNFTWDNERAVEVPIALDLIDRHLTGRILEVGNVLSHYVAPEWDIIDKFEPAACVTCADAVDFSPAEPYDIIVSISTLEHVGFDDEIRDPSLIPRAIGNLRSRCLAPGGTFVATIPVGYNPHLDNLLFGGKLGETGAWFLKRTSRYVWREAGADEVRNTGYADKYIEAGALAVIEFSAPAASDHIGTMKDTGS